MPELTINFSTADLRHVRIADHPTPMLDLTLLLASLQQNPNGAAVAPWRHRWSALAAQTPLPRLIAPNGIGPMFLDPPAATFAEGIDTVAATDGDQVHRDLARVIPAHRPLTRWAGDLADRKDDAWETLELGLRHAYDVLLRPCLDRVHAAREVEVAWLSHRLAAGGTGGLLADLCPGGHWRGDSLVLPRDHDTEVSLGGSGLIVQPSAVWTGPALVTDDTYGPPMLLYPAGTPLVQRPAPPESDRIAHLLGRTRASVLRALDKPRTTTELATALNISLGGASQHAATLRQAHLITTRRDGRAVRHLISPLGAALIAGAIT